MVSDDSNFKDGSPETDHPKIDHLVYCKKLSPLMRGELVSASKRVKQGYQRKRTPAVVCQVLLARKPLARPPLICSYSAPM